MYIVHTSIYSIAHSHSNIWPNQSDAAAALRRIHLKSNATNELAASERNTNHISHTSANDLRRTYNKLHIYM